MRRRSTNQFKTVCQWLMIAYGVFIALPMAAQIQPSDSALNNATLDQVVRYALVHQPALRQAQLDRRIVNMQVMGRLADWYPQLNFVYNYQHNIIVQKSVINGAVIPFGVHNTSALQLNATQNLFNRDVVLASQTASNVKTQAEYNERRSELDVVTTVTKAFYDLLATIQQIRIGEEDIVRLKRSLKDATSRYNSGIADKTDPKRAQILLANSDASLKGYKEALDYKIQFLKAQIGYPVEGDLTIRYDTLQMENEIALDTAEVIDYNANVDYRILFITRELQNANVKYTRWGFVPSANLFGSYIYNFQNNDFNELYKTKYPFVYVGGTLAFPIFQGLKRVYNLQQQKYALQRADWELSKLKNNLNTEYARSVAAYKSSLARYLALKDNVLLAKEVYDVIQLQYSNGVRPYLDVTVAETDLQTARINYFNALYSVLASKMDVLRAKGETTNN
jgi:outer membrane protein